MARLRTFVAVDLGKIQKDRCVSMQEALSLEGIPVSWVDRNNLHVTLLFLGEIEYLEIPTVCQLVNTVAAEHAPFDLELRGIGGFPGLHRPRTIFASVERGQQELSFLHTEIETKLMEAVRYRRENRPYVPHVTLGRPRVEENSPLSALLLKYSNWHGGSHRVTEIQVLSSQLTQDGPIYSVLSRGKLKG